MKPNTKITLAREYLSFLLWFGIPALATLILLAVYGNAPWWSPLAFGAAGYAWNKFYRFNVWVYQTLRYPPPEASPNLFEKLPPPRTCGDCGAVDVSGTNPDWSLQVGGFLCPECNRRRCAG